MNNMITAWKERAKDKHGSVADGVRMMNMVCNSKISPSGIDQMESGTRRIPEAAQRYIMNEILLTELESAKNIDRVLGVDFEQLRDRLSPPLRVKS